MLPFYPYTKESNRSEARQLAKLAAQNHTDKSGWIHDYFHTEVDGQVGYQVRNRYEHAREGYKVG